MLEQLVSNQRVNRIFRFFEQPLIASTVFVMMLITVLILSSCQSLGIPQTDTFNKKALAGYTAVASVRDTATTLLNAHKISAADTLNVQIQADRAHEAIALARQLHATDAPAAENKLSVALDAIAALQAYLNTRGSQ